MVVLAGPKGARGLRAETPSPAIVRAPLNHRALNHEWRGKRRDI